MYSLPISYIPPCSLSISGSPHQIAQSLHLPDTFTPTAHFCQTSLLQRGRLLSNSRGYIPRPSWLLRRLVREITLSLSFFVTPTVRDLAKREDDDFLKVPGTKSGTFICAASFQTRRLSTSLTLQGRGTWPADGKKNTRLNLLSPVRLSPLRPYLLTIFGNAVPPEILPSKFCLRYGGFAAPAPATT